MRIALDALPTDPTTLQQLVRDPVASLDNRDATVAESRIEIDRLG